MGRIRTKWMKTASIKLVEKNPDTFSDDFKKNKEELNKTNLFDFSKKIRNKIAGYIVRTVNKKKSKI